MKAKAKKILERIGDNIPLIFIIWTLLLIYVISMQIKIDNEMVNVDGVIVDKDETRLHYIFMLMEDNGNVIKFSVDIDDWYAYKIGDRYSNEIKRGDFISEDWWR